MRRRGHLTNDDQGQKEAEGGIPHFPSGLRCFRPGGWGSHLSTSVSVSTTSTKLGWCAFGCGFAYGAQHAELWFTYGANSTTATSST